MNHPPPRSRNGSGNRVPGGFPDAWRRLAGSLGVRRATPALIAGAGIVSFWIVCALWAPMLVPYDPFATHPLQALLAPSAHHWFGTDQLGRDVFSRVLTGARDVLSVAPLATLLGALGGTAVGLLAGYLGGWVDQAIGRVLDALLALPLVIVALLALAALGGSDLTMILVIGATFAPMSARTVRAAVLSERHLDYVAAAQSRGESTPRILYAEILPNVMKPIIVEAAVRLGYAIFTVATLSFLGFGTQPPSPDWGLTLSENYTLLAGGAWWTVAFSAAATASLVIGVNLVADALQRTVTR
ncbi:MAG: ABC transporter permease [Janthinobacterium lividum]